MSHPTVYLRDISRRPRFMTSWERYKHNEAHWAVEMVAEMLGVFLYVYAGLGATAAFVVGTLTGQGGIGSLYTVGFAYAIGIVLAVTLCSSTSGGHFSPGVTITFVLFRDFPVRKAVRYIFAQILAGYLACLIVYVQWKDLLTIAEEVLVAKGAYDSTMFTSSGPAGVFALFVAPGTNLHRVLLNEFVTDFIIGLAIWGCLDPTNHMIPPVAAPWLIGLTYGVAIWGYSPTSIAANTARDLGGRLMALSIWGLRAAGGPYAAISALTNIPATIFAAFIYETFLGSATRTLTPGHVQFLGAHKRYYEDNGLAPQGYLDALGRNSSSSSNFDVDEKHTAESEVLEVPSSRV